MILQLIWHCNLNHSYTQKKKTNNYKNCYKTIESSTVEHMHLHKRHGVYRPFPHLDLQSRKPDPLSQKGKECAYCRPIESKFDMVQAYYSAKRSHDALGTPTSPPPTRRPVSQL